MNKVICPFCKNSDNLKPSDTIKSYNSDTKFTCMAHKNQVVIFDPTFYPGGIIRISYNNYCISIFLEYKKMFIDCYSFDKLNKILHNISLDPNLTPENVDEKIKVYLTFQ